jgi:hypothetical protein
MGIGSFLGGASEGMAVAKKQMLDEKTQADSQALGQAHLQLAQQAGGRAAANDAHALAKEKDAKVDAAANDIWSTMVTMSEHFQQNGHGPEEAAKILMPMAQQALDLYHVTGRDQDAKTFEAKFKALTTIGTADKSPKFAVSGENGPGMKQYTQTNPAAEGGVRTSAPSAGSAADLPTDAIGNQLTGSDLLGHLKKTDPGLGAIVEQTVEGKLAPPSALQMKQDSAKWGKVIALAQAVDPTWGADKWGGRTKARNEFMAGGPMSPVGTITAGQGAIQHLAEVAEAAVGLKNHSGWGPLTKTINMVGNEAARQSGTSSPQISFHTSVGKFAPEATRLYRGAGGAESDVQRDIHDFEADAAPSELAAALEANKTLMLEKLAVMQDRWHANVTDKTDYPIENANLKAAIKRIDESIVALRQQDSSTKKPDAAAAPVKNMGSSLSSQQAIEKAKAALATVPAANQAAAKAAMLQQLRATHPDADF